MSAVAEVLQEDWTLLVPAQAAPRQMSQHETLWSYLALALAAALLLAAGVWIWRHWRARSTPREAADLVALRELVRWQGLDDKARFREAVAEISGTVRGYAAARFGLRAPTLTTEEFWMRYTSGHIPTAYTPFWTDFLAASDTIKYAGLTPEHEQFRKLLFAATEFVRSSRQAA